MTPQLLYHPDFDEDCRICGNSPCVIVAGHSQPRTRLCGVDFFHNEAMVDWENWNEGQENQDD